MSASGIKCRIYYSYLYLLVVDINRYSNFSLILLSSTEVPSHSSALTPGYVLPEYITWVTWCKSSSFSVSCSQLGSVLASIWLIAMELQRSALTHCWKIIFLGPLMFLISVELFISSQVHFYKKTYCSREHIFLQGKG